MKIERVKSYSECNPFAGRFMEIDSGCNAFYKFQDDNTPYKKGKFISWRTIARSACVTDKETGRVVIQLIRPKTKLPGKDFLSEYLGRYAKNVPSFNRSFAAGYFDLKRTQERLPQTSWEIENVDSLRATKVNKNGIKAERPVNNPVNSAIIGFSDSSVNGNRCRSTFFNNKFPEQYKNSIPFFESISQIFADAQPELHYRQLSQFKPKYMKKVQIGKSCFSTVTVNQDFRTGLHTDKGDFKEGMGVLYMSAPGVKGGEILFPEYGLAVAMKDNDILLFDTQLWHTTASYELPNNNTHRVSFVCYLRENLLNTCAL